MTEVHQPAAGTASGVDLAAIAPGLARGPDGIWTAGDPTSVTPVSYPIGGHADCLQLEETSFWFRHRNACIAAAVHNHPPLGPLLDLGAGNGFVSLGLRASGFETLTMEAGTEGARNARARGLDPVLCASFEAARFASDSLAAVGMFDVLEHVEDDIALLRSLHGPLRAGGLLYLSLPAYPWLWSADDPYAGHFRRFTRRSLARRLRRGGFDLVYASYLFSFLPPAILMFKTLPSQLGLLRTDDPERYARQHGSHASQTGLGSGLIEAILARELAVVQRGKSLPFGGSLLAVARRSAGEPAS